MADDGYIAIVCGESAEWAHWDNKVDAMAAAKTHLEERLWERYKHSKDITLDMVEEIIKEADFRVYRLGDECYRVAMPWTEWIQVWQRYRDLNRHIEKKEQELKEEHVVLLNHLNDWNRMNEDKANGFSMGAPSTEVLQSYRRYTALKRQLEELKLQERVS